MDGSGERMRTGAVLRASNGQGRDAVTGAHTRAKRALWPRPEHARQAFGKMPRYARGLE